MNKFGYANRDQFNVAGGTVNIDNRTTYTAPEPITVEPDPTLDPVPAASHRARWYVVLAAFGILLLGFIKLVLPSQPDLNAFPTKTDAWPAGATRDALLDSVTAAWQSCAQAVVLAPANCPAHITPYPNNNIDQVHWALHGNPVDGAIMRYRNQDHLFHVLGSVVLTVTYHSSGGPGFASLHIYYWARVTWSQGKAAVADLASYDGQPPPPIAKRDPATPWDAVKPLVAQAFAHCFASKTMPMPGDCPNSSSYAGQDKATWTPLGDPLINAKPHFEPKFGLIHVIGSYSARVHYSLWPFGPQSEVQGGDYDAMLAVDDGKPVLLQIIAT